MTDNRIVPASQEDYNEANSGGEPIQSGGVLASGGRVLSVKDSGEEHSSSGIKGFSIQDIAFDSYNRLDISKYLSYSCFKTTFVYFLDSAKITVSIQFSDIMMLMTIFVLYGDEIRILGAGPQHDNGFDIMTSICFFFFVFEIVFGTWSKTTFKGFYPLKFEGYLLSFYFWLDLVAIISMFPDIPWIANPLGMGNISNNIGGNSNLTKAGRVVRMVRLVRLVKMYKIAEERRTVRR